jgi:3-methyladenine DNA glycosylase AlkD
MKRTAPAETPPPPGSGDDRFDWTMEWLRRHATRATRDGMVRYGVPNDNALGVTVGDLKRLGKLLGRDHSLAAELWRTRIYEARMLTSFVDDPASVTPEQMERWAGDFDNWGICDTLCFNLFDRTPHAWEKVAAWRSRPEEFVKRAAFALLWGLTGHDKRAPDARFAEGLGFIEAAATDERHYVMKAVNMALRAIGKRKAALLPQAVALARRLAASQDPAARWVGSDALRELAPAKPRKSARGS